MIAHDQMAINTYQKEKAAFITPAKITEDANLIMASGKDFSVIVDKASGLLVSYEYKGKEYILSQYGPRPSFGELRPIMILDLRILAC